MRGWLAAACAALLSGSFSVAARCSAACDVPPHVFNALLCCGIVLTSAPLVWFAGAACLGSWQGLLSGSLFACGTAASMFAIRLAGLAQAVGVGSGVAALVSFAFGVLREPGRISDMQAGGAGIACLLAGLAGVAGAGALQQALDKQQREAGAGNGVTSTLDRWGRASPLLWRRRDSQLDQPLLAAPGWQQQQQQQQQGGSRLAGCLLAALTGLLGGLMLAPMDSVSQGCHGLAYQPALAVGVAASIVPVTLVCHLATGWQALRTIRLAILPGLVSGAVWTAGSVCSVVAASHIGVGLAYPIQQAGLLVAGAWGCCCFSELRAPRAQGLFWAGGAALLAGCWLLAHAAAAASR